MKTTNESYLKQTKRAFTLSKFSRYKFNQNSKTDLIKSIKTFNKTSNRLENLYLTKEERNHKNWVKRHILVKTFTFKMKNKIVSTVSVSQDEINILNSITPLTPTKSINKINSQIKRVFTLTQLNYFKSDLFSYFKNLNRLRNKIDSLTYQRNLLIAS